MTDERVLSLTDIAYVLDSSSLIHVERSSDLRKLPPPNVRLFIPDRVAREVNKPRQPLERWLQRHYSLVTRMLPDEGRDYLTFRIQPETKLDDGEAAALAVAVNRDAALVTDDMAAQRKAASHGVRCLGTTDFLREAVPKQLRMDNL